jgi:hypothetical protein
MTALRGILFALILSAATGCGNNGLIRISGQLTENGKPVSLTAGESVQIDFITADGAYPPLNLGAYADSSGRFAVDMNDGTGNGLPPGKYKVKLNHEGTSKKMISPKLFKEPHPIEVTAQAPLHLVVDLVTGTVTP